MPKLARATPEEVAAAIDAITGEAKPQEGRVKLDIPAMVENGNAVGLTVGVADAAPRCTDLYLFSERNPLPRVLRDAGGEAVDPSGLTLACVMPAKPG